MSSSVRWAEGGSLRTASVGRERSTASSRSWQRAHEATWLASSRGAVPGGAALKAATPSAVRHPLALRSSDMDPVVYSPVMALETTSIRLWKRLSPQERLAAATHFWKETPQTVYGTALGAIVRARKLRPQAARALPPEQQARILAGVLDPGETVAAFLLVALHLGERRPLLRAFLDALGLPHEDGVLKEEADAIEINDAKIEAAVGTIAKEFPREQVEIYLNTLWLQDPERWEILTKLEVPQA